MTPVGTAAAQTPAADACAPPLAATGPWNAAYQIATTWEATPGAPVQRATGGTMGQPTPLNVDADPQTDLVATLSAAATGAVLFDVVRAAGETDALPVSVLATVSTPSAQDPAARRFTLGYDSRPHRAPNGFRVSAQVTADAEQRFVVSQQGPGPGVALVSSFVAGGACTTPADLRVDFGTSPAQAAVRAKVGQEVRVALTTSAPGPVTVSSRRVVGGADERVRMAVEGTPAQVALVVAPYAGTITFDAPVPVPRVVTTVNAAAPGPLGAQHIEATLVGVPASVALSLLPADGHLVLQSTQPIGEVDVRARSANRAFPQVPAGEVGLIFDATGGGLAMAARGFQLRLLDVFPSAGAITAQMQSGRRLVVDARRDAGPAPVTFDAVVDTLPSSFRTALEPAPANRFVVSASAPVAFVRLARTGVAVLPGAPHFAAELVEAPAEVAVTLPATGSAAAVRASGAGGAPAPVGQLRLTVSDGTKPLPAFVSDAQFQANPSNTAFRDLLQTDTGAAPSSAVLRLTAVNSLDFTLAPLALTMSQDGARARPLAFEVRAPNTQTGVGMTSLTGVLNRPSASTVVAFDVAPDRPTRLRFENAAPVGAFTLSALNLGTVPEAHLSLANIPTRLSVCMHTDSQCRPTDRLPTPLQDYAAFQGSPAQSATAGGGNRPYSALAALSFDDHGTSGTSSALSSMVTLNATIRMSPNRAPIIITNLRFHSLTLDVGLHPTNPTFSSSFTEVPRLYLYLDSRAVPFVMNEIRYPDFIESFKVGTDGQPAVADRRLVWVPGNRCTAGSFGTCVQTGLDVRTSGSLNCGGQRSFVVRMSGISVNLLNIGGVHTLPICS